MMNNNTPPDDFGFPDDDESQNDDPMDELTQGSNNGNHQDGKDGHDILSDNDGLPEDWEPKHIPNEKDFTMVGARRLGELKDNLDQANDHKDIARHLEAIKETIRQTHWLPKLVPLVVETGLAVRSPSQKIGRIDIWEDIIFLLFHTIHDQLKTVEERSEYFKRIFTSLSDFKAVASSKFPTESAMKELASEYGMDDSDQSDWLLARAAFLNAVILDYPLENAVSMADELIWLARRNHDLMTEMRVYVSKARRYIQENDYRRGFVLSQQALTIAVRINAERFYSDILSNILSCAIVEHRTEYVEALFDYWQQLRPHLEENVYEKGPFLSLRGKYYFDRKKDYHRAAEAFEGAYECDKIQQKAVAQATQLLGWGMAMTKAGEYEIAQELYHQALNIHRKEGNGEMEIWIRHAIGWNAKESGDIDMGILHLVDALERALDLPMTARLENICKGIKEDLDLYRSSLNRA